MQEVISFFSNQNANHSDNFLDFIKAELIIVQDARLGFYCFALTLTGFAVIRIRYILKSPNQQHNSRGKLTKVNERIMVIHFLVTVVSMVGLAVGVLA